MSLNVTAYFHVYSQWQFLIWATRGNHPGWHLVRGDMRTSPTTEKMQWVSSTSFLKKCSLKINHSSLCNRSANKHEVLAKKVTFYQYMIVIYRW